MYQLRKSRDLSVIAIIHQNALGNPATKSYCKAFENKYETTYPVLIDPTGRGDVFFDEPISPLNMVLNDELVIVWKGYGGDPFSLGSAIDVALAGGY